MMLAGLPVPDDAIEGLAELVRPPAPTTWADRLGRAAPTCSDLGLERHAVDAIFRALPVIVLGGTRGCSCASATTSACSNAPLRRDASGRRSEDFGALVGGSRVIQLSGRPRACRLRECS